ncbi:hypothetical protein PENSOL_c065G05435 [Penicillium solitum]|uniref:Uncharacterized protein n=1 Tax=Penicillium solitum TaxID=60172 RepID=A0A1V6QJ88_9EURO|nr:uncharacterized protein PENSOL_c065G05435 [Penicillium solitum]OQD89265.1 hypothetical protein PENSOL_c065G05435 [Penicillium solitum]
MDDVRRDADNIERAVTEESEDMTPSLERQRTDYQYPFSSPTQQASPVQQASISLSRKITQAPPVPQASVSPSREITQAIEITETTTNTENIPVTARSEMSPSRKIISIKSSPDPISQDLAIPAPTLPRRSRRANIGIAPNRYYDPKQKHLAVEYKKRDRDIQRAAIRAKAKDSGGNNVTEGDR